jgi:predicted ATP-binding protein involved in virulence
MTNKKQSTELPKIKRNAEKGNFESAYYLYELYKEGKYVDKNNDESQKYLSLAYKIFSNQNIRINEIVLENFRAFKDFRLQIPNENMTVIIGNNGAGKTTILDSIAMSMSWLHNRITKNGGNGETIHNLDVKLGINAPYSSIVSKFKINKAIHFSMELAIPAPGSAIKKKNTIADVTKIGSFYKEAYSLNKEFNFPLLAYYTVSRSLGISKKDVVEYAETATITEFNQFDGYSNSLDGKADFQSFFRWYKRLDDISSRRKNNDTKSNTFPGFKQQLELMAETDEDARALLDKLGSQIKPEKSKDEPNRVDTEKIKRLINNVVGHFMEGYGNLEIQLEPFLGITVEKNGEKLNVLQLSQGEKSLLALIVDIARRLIILNPSLDNPLEGKGIVLIDEYEMHIHPAWQRALISGLTKAFKNCQFIITTHSPQMLGEIKPSQIIMLQRDEKNNIGHTHPEQSYGLTSNQILDYLMTPSHSKVNLFRNEKVAGQLKVIQDLIENEDFTEATNQIENLEIELNGPTPELISAKVDIDLYHWDE